MHWALPNSEVYQTERYGHGQSFKYFLPVAKDGLYTLILKFSEIYFTEPGQKVFDVMIGSRTVIADLDILARVRSRGIPYDEFLELTVKNQKVYYQGEEMEDGVRNGKLVVEFGVGKADNPKVNGIVLVEGGLTNTHYYAHQRY